MNLGQSMFREIAESGKVKENADKRMMIDNIEAWKSAMRTEANPDIRDILLHACRNSSWVHQRLMSGEQLSQFNLIIESVKQRYIDMTVKVNPDTAKLADVVEEMFNDNREF